MWIVGESRLSDYTINRRQNGYGAVNKTFALKSLMANCLDFEENKVSLLQSMGREMGFFFIAHQNATVSLPERGLSAICGDAPKGVIVVYP